EGAQRRRRPVGVAGGVAEREAFAQQLLGLLILAQRQQRDTTGGDAPDRSARVAQLPPVRQRRPEQSLGLLVFAYAVGEIASIRQGHGADMAVAGHGCEVEALVEQAACFAVVAAPAGS